MPPIINRHSLKNAFLGSRIVIGLSTTSYAEDEGDPQSVISTNSKGEAFTVIDVDAINDYQDKRRARLVESLTLSNLSNEHQDLLSSVMAKVFVGIPVSTFTETNRYEYKNEEPVENTDNWAVSDLGHIRHEIVPTLFSLTKASPFTFLPPVPFLPETGTLTDESDVEAKFEFDIDLSKFGELGESEIPDYPGILNLIVEVVANKIDQTPKRITMRLKNPLRQRFVFFMKTISMEYHYTFVESCGCSAISKSKTLIEGSVIFLGRIFASSESTFNNIECEQPLSFLLPDIEKAAFLPL